EAGHTYTRARQLCEQLDDPQQLFPVLRGLCNYYHVRAELQTAHTLGEQFLTLAQQVQDSAMLVAAHRALAGTLFYLGEITSALTHATKGMAFYNSQQHRTSAFLYGEDAGVVCQSFAARALWYLGYPAQSLVRSQEAVTLAQQINHPFSLCLALGNAAIFHQCRQEGQATHAYAEATIPLGAEQGFAFWRARSVLLRAWALAQQGQQGIEQINHAMIIHRASGAALLQSYYLALLADAYGLMGQQDAGLELLKEALTLADTTGGRWYD